MLLIIFGLFGIPLILIVLGFNIKKKRPNAAKALFITAVLYLIIGLGSCAIIISQLSIY